MPQVPCTVLLLQQALWPNSLSRQHLLQQWGRCLQARSHPHQPCQWGASPWQAHRWQAWVDPSPGLLRQALEVSSSLALEVSSSLVLDLLVRQDSHSKQVSLGDPWPGLSQACQEPSRQHQVLWLARLRRNWILTLSQASPKLSKMTKQNKAGRSSAQTSEDRFHLWSPLILQYRIKAMPVPGSYAAPPTHYPALLIWPNSAKYPWPPSLNPLPVCQRMRLLCML